MTSSSPTRITTSSTRTEPGRPNELETGFAEQCPCPACQEGSRAEVFAGTGFGEAALACACGLKQRQVAKLLGASQLYVAKLESGRVRNLGVGTLVKYAQALGGTVTVRIRPRVHPMAAHRARLKKAG